MNRPFQLSITIAIFVLSGTMLWSAKVNAESANITASSLHSSTQIVALIGQNSVDSACSGVALSATSSGCPDESGTINSILGDIINILGIVVGIAAVLMLVVGGFKYITSGGDSSKTASARNTVIYSIIGLVIAVMAQVLVHFVLFRVSS